MTESVPPLHWLLLDPRRRSRAWRYWVVDTAVGFYNSTLHYLMRALPIDACSGLGAFLAFYSPFVYRASDTRARKAWVRLRAADSDPAAVDAAMRRLWRCVGRTMAEFSVLHRLWRAGRISVTGVEHIHAARAAGKPLLIAALHLGNWETVLVAGISLGLGGAGLYLPPENRFDLRIVRKARDRYQGGQVPAAGPEALHAALHLLRARREPFVIFVDELARGRVQAPAFGRRLGRDSNIAYAARLAAMTKAALIPAYCVRLGEAARFEVHVLPPIEMIATEDRDAELDANIERINAVIEPVVRDYLDQWFFLLDLEFEDEAAPSPNAGPNRP